MPDSGHPIHEVKASLFRVLGHPARVRILELLRDGERSVGHIIEESLFPKFTVLRTLYGLAQRGVIKIRDRGEGAIGTIRDDIRRAAEAR